MKVYLRTNGEWKLFKGDDLKDEFGKREIRIVDHAEIGYDAKIGNYAEIGDYAKIGNYAKIGYDAEIGYYAEIGDHAKIGNYAKIGKIATDCFTESNIFIRTGIVMQNERGIFYKAVQKNLADWHTGNYQYIIGKGDQKNLERNQDMDCGDGWHFTGLWNAIAFLGKKEGKIISAEISLEDILSVYNKIRVKAFSNVQIVELKGITKS
jgi:hypothetical protein